jgi:hypothetical protein
VKPALTVQNYTGSRNPVRDPGWCPAVLQAAKTVAVWGGYGDLVHVLQSSKGALLAFVEAVRPAD